MTAQQEAQEINRLIPNPYIPGAYYPVEFSGKQIKIARKCGVGRNSGNYYLHVLVPCVTVVKSPTGEILGSQPGKRHYAIKLFDDSAKWKEL